VISRSLASPTPPAGGITEEKGDEENKTKPRRDLRGTGGLGGGKGDKTLAKLAEQFRVHPTQIPEWKHQLLGRAANVLGDIKPTSDMPNLKVLHAKIGQMALENDSINSLPLHTGESI
jgi:transposase